MADRIFGIMFLLLGSLGYLCIAEDPRYWYEIIGVSAVFIAGAVLTVGGFHWLSVRPVMARSIAVGLLIGIGGGAAMGDIPNGVAMGLVFGAIAGALIVRSRRKSDDAEGTPPPPTPGPHP